MIRQNLERVRGRIAASARAAGRDTAGIRLIAVTKGVPAERIREAVDCGVTEIGENRVQEAAEKRGILGTVPGADCPQITWHLIGHLQKNKAGRAVELFEVIHSVDSAELVGALDRRAAGELEVLIQVNVAGEAAKHGCTPEEVGGLAQAVLRSKNLVLSGLMTIPPFTDDPEDARPVFRRLRGIRDGLQAAFGLRLGLSMGMSHDFEVAVQEGATMLRIGTAIFGERGT